MIRRAAAGLGAPVVSVPDAYRWGCGNRALSGRASTLRAPGGYEGSASPWSVVIRSTTPSSPSPRSRRPGIEGSASDEPAIRRGLATTEWPGRLQIVEGRPRIILDGAHNPAGAQVLAAFLAEHRAELGRLILVFGVLKDKDWEAMLGMLAPSPTRSS